MIALIQRVKHARVLVENKVVGSIEAGLLVFLGVASDDREGDVELLSRKLVQLRIFSDAEGKMNKSVLDVHGEILVVSQFTLLANASQGNRPSYIAAARPEKAIPLYELFVNQCRNLLGKEIKTGIFGADMQVELLNDGPVTLHLDTANGFSSPLSRNY